MWWPPWPAWPLVIQKVGCWVSRFTWTCLYLGQNKYFRLEFLEKGLYDELDNIQWISIHALSCTMFHQDVQHKLPSFLHKSVSCAAVLCRFLKAIFCGCFKFESSWHENAGPRSCPVSPPRLAFLLSERIPYLREASNALRWSCVRKPVGVFEKGLILEPIFDPDTQK